MHDNLARLEEKCKEQQRLTAKDFHPELLELFDRYVHASRRDARLRLAEGPGEDEGHDTTPRYDKPAAELSWQRTIDFFNKNLRTGGRATNQEGRGSWLVVGGWWLVVGGSGTNH